MIFHLPVAVSPLWFSANPEWWEKIALKAVYSVGIWQWFADPAQLHDSSHHLRPQSHRNQPSLPPQHPAVGNYRSVCHNAIVFLLNVLVSAEITEFLSIKLELKSRNKITIYKLMFIMPFLTISQPSSCETLPDQNSCSLKFTEKIVFWRKCLWKPQNLLFCSISLHISRIWIWTWIKLKVTSVDESENIFFLLFQQRAAQLSSYSACFPDIPALLYYWDLFSQPEGWITGFR